MKKCGRCGITKSALLFNKHSRSKDGLQNYCKECNKLVTKEYDKCDINRRRRKLFAKYGLTLEDYDALLKAQNGVCAICGCSDTKNSYTKYLVVDHCHTTGKIRGLLCDYCNVGLGRFLDNIELLKSAVQYLTKDTK